MLGLVCADRNIHWAGGGSLWCGHQMTLVTLSVRGVQSQQQLVASAKHRPPNPFLIRESLKAIIQITNSYALSSNPFLIRESLKVL